MTRSLASKRWLALVMGLTIVAAILAANSFLTAFFNNLEQVEMADQILVARETRSLAIFSNLPADDLCLAGGTEKTGIEAGSRPFTQGSGCSSLTASRLACLKGQPEIASELLRAAESDCPRRKLVDEWAGQLAWAIGDKEEAIYRWSLHDQTTQVMFTWASEFFRRGDLDDSRYLLQAALPLASAQTPASELGQAYTYLGLIYRRLSDWPGAASAFARAAELTPDRWSSWLILGGAQRNVGDLASSYESLRQALSLAPADNARQVALIYEQIGRTQKDMGRYDDAYESTLQSFCQMQKSSGSGDADLRRLSKLLNQLSLETGREEAGDIRLEACP